MPSTADYVPVDRRVADLRDQLAELDARTEADPLALAPDLESWRDRDSARRDQRIELESQVRRLTDLGELVDDPELLGHVETYLSATAEARTALSVIVRRQRWARTGPGNKGDAVGHLTAWWRQLARLGGQLPELHDAAARFIRGQLDAWFTARNVIALVRASDDGIDWPAPEHNGTLPHCLVLGVHNGDVR